MTDTTSAAPAVAVPSESEKAIRRLLCSVYAGPLAYTDDGEAQDNREHPHIDFMRDSADEIQAKMQRSLTKLSPAAQAAPGVDALMCVISSLRDTAHFRDEEGGVTNDLCELRDWIAERLAAPQPAVAAGWEFPALTLELASILGTMCFQCIPFAQALRIAGHKINTRAEDEQAATLHWMLGHYFRHGEDGWRQAAMDDMERMRTAALQSSSISRL